MRARLVIGSLLALSLVSGPHGIAQEAEKPLTPRPSLDALRVPTDAEDAALFHTIVRTLTHDLELPVAGVTLETLDAATFAQVLANARVGQDPSDLRGAAGVALGHRILVRSDVLSRMTIAQRARLYAHELAHAAQVRLGDHGEPSLTWIDEGHATWVAYRVGDRLGHRPYAESRDEVRRWVRASSPSERFPVLSDLETSDRWILAAKQIGWVATYGQAFLAVDRLVERYSAAKLRELFRRSGDSDSRLRAIDARSAFAGLFAQRDWNAVFPIAYRDFVGEFRADLETLH
jgi:hypothetical protein